MKRVIIILLLIVFGIPLLIWKVSGIVLGYQNSVIPLMKTAKKMPFWNPKKYYLNFKARYQGARILKLGIK